MCVGEFHWIIQVKSNVFLVPSLSSSLAMESSSSSARTPTVLVNTANCQKTGPS